jgi:hypothetical protein
VARANLDLYSLDRGILSRAQNNQIIQRQQGLVNSSGIPKSQTFFVRPSFSVFATGGNQSTSASTPQTFTSNFTNQATSQPTTFTTTTTTTTTTTSGTQDLTSGFGSGFTSTLESTTTTTTRASGGGGVNDFSAYGDSREEPNRLISPSGALIDFFVITYGFTTGQDLDTRTSIRDPRGNTFTPSLGWCREEDFTNLNGRTVLEWAGDNTGLGVESVLFNGKEYDLAYPNSNLAVVQLRAFWFVAVGDSVTITIKGYTGGEMYKSDFSWENDTADIVWDDFAVYRSLDVRTNTQGCAAEGDFIAYVLFDRELSTAEYSQVL